MDTLLQDLRQGIRILFRSPGFTALAVLALALGIGGTTAIFSVIDTVLLRPLPFPQPERLVMIWEHNLPRGRERNVVSPSNFQDWKSRSQAFERMAVFGQVRLNLTGSGEPEEVSGQQASADFLPLLGIQPALGRTFTAAEDAPGAAETVVLGYGLWQRRFGGDPRILGQTLTLSQTQYTVIGVMPQGFAQDPDAADYWIPIHLDPSEDYRSNRGRYLLAIGRLKPGVKLAAAQAELKSVATQLEGEHKEFNTGWSVNLVGLSEQVTGEVRPALLVLMGAVAFVLLIACANVASLLLARTAARHREIAIRRTLGATRWRIARQLLTESVLLAMAGGVLGLLLATWGVSLLLALVPDLLPRAGEVEMNGHVLLFTSVVAVMTGLLFGLAPALAVPRVDLQNALRSSDRGGTSGVTRARARSVLVVGEVGLAVVLLVGAGLLINSFASLMRVNPGFDPDHVLTMRLILPSEKYTEGPQRSAFFEQLAERVRALPGVTSASGISFLPLTGMAPATSFTIEGRPAPDAGQAPVTDVRMVLPEYFATLRVPLVRGRLLTQQDLDTKARVTVVSESMVQRHFPDEDPIGKRLIVNWSDPAPDEIVGVVGDVKHYGLDSETRPTVYWAHSLSPLPLMTIVARTAVDPEGIAAAARAEVRALDPDQPMPTVRTLDELLARSVAQRRFNMILLGVFATIALVLASIGIYGLISYGVAQRTKEIGIRMALGARQSDVLRQVTREGLRLAIAGVALGLVGAWGLTRWMSTLLFDVRPTDPATFTLVAFLLIVVSGLASFIPARKAARLDPMVALRQE